MSLWVRHVQLSAEAQARLQERVRNGPLRSAAASIARSRAIRAGYQEEGRRLARNGDPEYAAGCMLYWAEGAKARNTVKVVNADPEVLVFFARFLREQFDVPAGRMRVYCNLFADHLDRQQEIEDFWLEQLRCRVPASERRS